MQPQRFQPGVRLEKPWCFWYAQGDLIGSRESESEVAQSCPTLQAPWTVAYRAPLSMGFSRQEYWSGLPFPSSRDLPDPGIKPRSPAFHIAGRQWATVSATREVSTNVNNPSLNNPNQGWELAASEWFRRTPTSVCYVSYIDCRGPGRSKLVAPRQTSKYCHWYEQTLL